MYVDGTEYGGIIDDEISDDTGKSSVHKWHGRTWHGVLAFKVIAPDDGQDYMHVTGDVNAVLRSIIRRIELDGVFHVPESDYGVDVDYKFDRYVDAYTGITKLLASVNMRLSIITVRDQIILSAAKIVEYNNDVDSDIMRFKIVRNYRPVNHLVCLGGGELKDRVVIDLYADAKGVVSDTQTLRGIDEITAIYDYSNADASELRTRGVDKLKALQSAGSIDVIITKDVEFYVGDYITGKDNTYGMSVNARVNKKILTVSNKRAVVDYKIGDVKKGESKFSGASESSGAQTGGTQYIAGSGITISGHTISADVTRKDVDLISARAEDAIAQASDAASAAESALAQVDSKAPKVHTHDYAGSTSPGGVANSAKRFETPIKITLTGAVNAAFTIDGSTDVTVNVTGETADAQFLTAWPVGSIYPTSSNKPPHVGKWRKLASMGGNKYLRIA